MVENETQETVLNAINDSTFLAESSDRKPRFHKQSLSSINEDEEHKSERKPQLLLAPGLELVLQEPVVGPPRAKWTRQIDFLLACIGFSVGLGNVWRFPYLCYKNGGGAFLVPYFIGVTLGGFPMFCLEVMMGQFMARGGIEVWNMVPLLKGLGYASAVVVFLLNCYYNVILAWTLYYLFSSFCDPVGWKYCGHSWNTNLCSLEGMVNMSTNSSAMLIDPAVEFWENKVLAISTGIDKMGSIKLDLMMCLIAAWIIVYFCIWKGIKTSGKVMYFTATSPYVLMFVLLIRAACLPGASNGLKYYLVPRWDRLGKLQVWVDAGTQIFFSYSIALGTLAALGSYNHYHHNSVKDCMLFAVINSGTSILAGFVIFMTLGFMSFSTGVDIDKVAASGPGLAFIVYPKALAQMPYTSVWAVLFFAMLILLGLDSQFVGVEGFITAVSDLFPVWMSKTVNKRLFILLVCICNFFVGLTMITNGGMFVFQIFDYYAGSRIIIIIGVMECLIVCYIYGFRRFSNNLTDMFGFSLGYTPFVFWGFLTPVYLLIIFIMSTIAYSELEYHRGFGRSVYVYPKWSIAVGWSLACIGMIFIPAVAIVKTALEPGSIVERIKYLLQPQFTQTDMDLRSSSPEITIL